MALVPYLVLKSHYYATLDSFWMIEMFMVTQFAPISLKWFQDTKICELNSLSPTNCRSQLAFDAYETINTDRKILDDPEEAKVRRASPISIPRRILHLELSLPDA